jgi:hypothetical protein
MTIHRIQIQPVLNGFVCQVGCQTVVFNDPDKMALEIARYYKNPKKVESEFVEKAVNQTMDMQRIPMPEPLREPDHHYTPNPAYAPVNTPPQPVGTNICGANAVETMGLRSQC